jgi:hypothetical protein
MRFISFSDFVPKIFAMSFNILLLLVFLFAHLLHFISAKAA